mgnify:CR=1 FL=1
MPKEETNSQKEIAAFLNNAVAAALRPARLGPIPEGRLKRLHLIAKALIAPAQELLEPDDDGVAAIDPEGERERYLFGSSLASHSDQRSQANETSPRMFRAFQSIASLPR